MTARPNHNQRSITWLTDRGWHADISEHRNPFDHRTHDLFGCIDIVALGPAGVALVQITGKSNMANRARKVEEAEAYGHICLSGAHVLVLGWHQPGGPRTRWVAVERWIVDRRPSTIGDAA